MAFNAGAITSKLTLDRKQFSTAVTSVGKQTKKMGNWAKQNSAQFKKMGLAIAAMGAVAVVTFTKMIKKYVETGDMIDKMSKRTGFAAETLSELAFAAEISGADITALEKGIKKMSKTVVDASYGLETYLRVFRSLGLSVEELMKLSPEEQFFKIGNAIAEMESVTLRTAAAVDVFGRAGTMLLPLFAEGAEGIEKLRKEARLLGIVFDEEAAAKAAKLKDAQTALKGAFQGLSFALVTEFIPVLTSVTTAFTDMAVDMHGSVKGMAIGILKFFKGIARGIKSLLLAWHGLAAGVSKIAEFLTTGITQQAESLLKIIKIIRKTTLIGKKVYDPIINKLEDLLDTLDFVSAGYKNLADEHINSTADIIIAYDKWIKRLENINLALTTTKTKAKGLGSTLIDTLIPAGKKFSTVLTAALTPALININNALLAVALTALHFTGALDTTILTANRLGDYIEYEFADAIYGALDAFQRLGEEGGSILETLGGVVKGFVAGAISAIKGFVTEILASTIKIVFAKQIEAIAGVIASVMTSLGFPFNLLAVGGAIAAVSALFSGLTPKSYKEGGYVPEETFAHLHAGEYVVPKEQVDRGAIGRSISITIAPRFNVSTMDAVGVDEFIRNIGLPAIVEALRVGIMKPEIQAVLGV